MRPGILTNKCARVCVRESEREGERERERERERECTLPSASSIAIEFICIIWDISKYLFGLS
jgi:hypothetical protein